MHRHPRRRRHKPHGRQRLRRHPAPARLHRHKQRLPRHARRHNRRPRRRHSRLRYGRRPRRRPPHKKLIVSLDGRDIDIALVDAVVLDDIFVGSRAIWDVGRIRQIIVTRGEPHNIGISAIAGHLAPVGPYEPRGLAVGFGPGSRAAVLAPVAPGVIVPVTYRDFRDIAPGEQIPVAHAPCVIALDGEREIEVRAGDRAAIRLTLDGPAVIDARAALAEASARGRFRLAIKE
jgi:hypothetical protein